MMIRRVVGGKLEVEIVLREFRRFLVLRIFSSGKSRNVLRCRRGEFVALLAMMMMMMTRDAGGSAVEGSEVVCLLDHDCASQSVACRFAK